MFFCHSFFISSVRRSCWVRSADAESLSRHPFVLPPLKTRELPGRKSTGYVPKTLRNVWKLKMVAPSEMSRSLLGRTTVIQRKVRMACKNNKIDRFPCIEQNVIEYVRRKTECSGPRWVDDIAWHFASWHIEQYGSVVVKTWFFCHGRVIEKVVSDNRNALYTTGVTVEWRIAD